MSSLEKSDWPHHDPNWEAAFDLHQAAFSELQGMPFDDAAFAERQEQMDEHLKGMKAAWFTQFRSASEYAQTLYQSGLKRQMENHVMPVVDFTSFKTKEDVDNWYTETTKQIEAQNARRGDMPIDRQSNIFKEETTYSEYRTYQKGRYGLRCIASHEVDEHGINVCLHQLPDNILGLTNVYENVATHYYAQELARIGGTPENIKWYMHYPSPLLKQEKFMRMEMQFDEKGFKNADFIHLDKVPAAINKAPTMVEFREEAGLQAGQQGFSTNVFLPDSPSP